MQKCYFFLKRMVNITLIISRLPDTFKKMCSVGDDVEEQENSKCMPEKPTFNLAENKCTKCRTEHPSLVLHNKYPYCKSCFIASTVHKFKALLGKNRVVHPNDKVLVYHKAGHPSTALLHFLRTGLNLTTPKRIRFEPIVLCIEDGYDLPLKRRLETLKQIDEEVKRFQFPLHFVSLAQYVLDTTQLCLIESYKHVIIDDDDINKIKAGLKKKANLTTLQEYAKMMECNLLLDAAKYLNCKCIFTPELGINIASQLLTSISLGRGAHAVFDVGTVDSRDTEVSIVRPLRNFTIKELAFYNIFNNLEPVSILPRISKPYASVQNLMEKFVSDLQVNYPATVSTIVRTSDKLGTDKNIKQNNRCPLCKVPIENESKVLESAEATKFSHWVSTQAPNCNISVEDRSCHLLESFSNSRDLNYCFACTRLANFL